MGGAVETWAIVLATALGPIAAVLITLWHQDRKQRHDAKMRLFLTLMAHRKAIPITQDWARALNLIDVIFDGDAAVLAAWRNFYDYIHVRPMDMKQFEHRHIELLSEMAKVLGYRGLKQTDIDKFYSPQALGDEAARAFEIQLELLRVLKGTERLSAVARDEVQVRPTPKVKLPE